MKAQTFYDLFNNVYRLIDHNGQEYNWIYLYDSKGRVVYKEYPDGSFYWFDDIKVKH